LEFLITNNIKGPLSKQLQEEFPDTIMSEKESIAAAEFQTGNSNPKIPDNIKQWLIKRGQRIKTTQLSQNQNNKKHKKKIYRHINL
jgi:hypothetical protein